jgi:hypothetical protein
MGGLEDERIKFAIETSNINTPEVLAAHFRILDEQRLGRSKPETVPSPFSQLALNVVAGAIFVGSASVTTIMTSDQLLNALCWRLNRNTSIS